VRRPVWNWYRRLNRLCTGHGKGTMLVMGDPDSQEEWRRRAILGVASARGLQVFTGSDWPGSGGQALYASRTSMTPSACPRLRRRPANVPFTW